MQKTTDRRRKKTAPIVVTALVILYMVPLVLMVLWAAAESRQMGQSNGWMLLPLLCYGLLGGAVVAGILLALRQRLEEIDGGEEDEACQY